MKRRWIPIVAICAAAVVVTVGFPLLGGGIAQLMSGNAALDAEIETTDKNNSSWLSGIFGDAAEEVAPEAEGEHKDSVTGDSITADDVADGDMVLDSDEYAGELGEGEALKAPTDSLKSETPPSRNPEVFAPEEPVDSAPAESEVSVPESTLQSGILTAGHWNDNENWSFWYKLQHGQQGYEKYLSNWDITLTRRVSVTTAPGATVKLLDAQNDVIWTAVADNQGCARLFWRVKTGDKREPASLIVSKGDVKVTHTLEAGEQKKNDLAVELPLKSVTADKKALELALVLDTTGSMGDELSYLQAELQSVVNHVKQQNANLSVKLSTNFYRDEGDLYEVETHPFTENIAEAVSYLKAQSADGGGDYEEAVEKALRKAVDGLQWSENSTKILLLVLDAPPHNTAEIRAEMCALMEDAAEKGIRVIPVASSGVDKATEFLMRALSITTGGDYVFLTDDSGVGGSHMEPTIGDHEVKKLNTLLVELINGYLK
ncbi:MAG: VWA domain-containing protein [Clostridia bacterium]|nr:VWA domain-containing protein [Clostridia bacterium]